MQTFLWLAAALLALKPPLSDPAHTAASPRFFKDRSGNTLLSWTEKNTRTNAITLFFAGSSDGGRTFTEKRKVVSSPALNTFAEMMPKLAYRADGSLVAVYVERQQMPDQKRAMKLLYSLSSDDGRHWSAPRMVHQDTTTGRVRGFFDLIGLADGQVAAVWLNDKPGRAHERSMNFAKTLKDHTFGEEKILDESVCDCCRTNLLVDDKGQLHVFFRENMDNVRDIHHLISADNGGRFTDAGVVYQDDWHVNGCPHTGPSSAQVGSVVLTTWFTGKSGSEGVKVADTQGRLWASLEGSHVKHPQLAAAGEVALLTWEETSEQPADTPLTRVGYQFLRAGKPLGSPQYLNTAGVATYPVATGLSDGQFVIAYEHQAAGEALKQVLTQVVGSAKQ